MARSIFIAGGSGYLGRHLIPELLTRSLDVRCLVRAKSQKNLSDGCVRIIGDALDHNTYKDKIAPADTFVHLVGVSNPNPLKAELFRKIDLGSVKEAVKAAIGAKIKHFVYVSVAHPAPVMKSYWRVRAECEKIIRENGLNATILRPWYILGPGHWWPYLFIPFYKLFENIPATAQTCKRLGLVTLPQMITALVRAIENPVNAQQIIAVSEIRGNFIILT